MVLYRLHSLHREWLGVAIVCGWTVGCFQQRRVRDGSLMQDCSVKLKNYNLFVHKYILLQHFLSLARKLAADEDVPIF